MAIYLGFGMQFNFCIAQDHPDPNLMDIANVSQLPRNTKEGQLENMVYTK
jgi:hypothetical protein